MSTIPKLRREDGSPSNWDRYLDLLAHRGVPERMRPWVENRGRPLDSDHPNVAIGRSTCDGAGFGALIINPVIARSARAPVRTADPTGL